MEEFLVGYIIGMNDWQCKPGSTSELLSGRYSKEQLVKLKGIITGENCHYHFDKLICIVNQAIEDK